MESAERAITDRFAFESRIGSGSFGEVFRGTDRETGATVAIKRLLAHTSDPIAAQRFHQEARLLARVHSPHVVGYVAHGHDHEGRLCLVLEWLQGQDLSRRQRAAPLTLGELLEAASQAAEGLAALHDAGIVHRDVKPSNFFLVNRPDGALHLKLIDLGIARSLTDDAITLEGFRVGTPAYMSPEQARGDAEITARTDVYSLGVVLFELVAKRRPFMGRDPFAVLAQIVLQVPPRLAELVPSVPPTLDEIVHRAMQRDPADRFLGARALGAAIRGVDAPSNETSGIGEDLATMALRSTGAVATAEQRVVTALFAGFRGVAADTDPFVRFESIVVSHGGVAHRTLGRRAVAVFGVERSSGDEALRAARAALESAATVKGSRVALSTCRVLTNAAGLSAEAIERGATQIEKPGEGIRVDAATARMIESQFRVESIDGDVLLRGERPTLDDTGPMLFGRETPLVGRERELAMLDACFTECTSEQVARAVLLLGPAGSGKSRIRFEWVKKLRARESTLIVLHGRGDPVTARSPFGVLARALRSHAGIVDGDPVERRQEKVRDVLLRAVRASDRERVGPFLGELAGVPFDDAGDDALRAARADPMLRGDAMRTAFESWLTSECEDGPVMIVLEDVQWVDLPSLKAIDAALRNLADRPLLLLAVGRQENREGFRASLPGATQEVVVSPLSKKSATRLVRDVLGDAAPDANVERLVERAEGNPFHLEELMRAIVAGQGDEIPDTVLGMVQARLDALGAEAKRVLRVASVFGQTFWRGGVVSLGGIERTQSTEEWLNELVRQEIVTRRKTSAMRGEVEFVFRNMLLRDAAYAMLTDEDRVHAHSLAAQWLEAAGALDAAALADHFERGQEFARAADWYVIAAEAALAGNDFAAAVKSASKAIDCGAAGTLAGRAMLIQAEAHRWRGALDECLLWSSEAADTLEGGSALWYRALGEAVAASIRTGKLADANALIERWRSARPGPESLSAAVATGARFVALMFTAGEAIGSEALLDEVRALGSGAVLEPSARARLAQAEAQARLAASDHVSSLHAVEASLREFQQAGDERNLNFQRVNIANLYIELGRFSEAERQLREVLGSSQRMGLKSLNAFAKHNLGRVLGLRGDYATGIAVERQAVEWFHTQGDPRMEAITRVYVSEILTRQEQFDEAEREARTAFEMSIASAPVAYVQAAAQLAIVLLAKCQPEDALAFARQGLVRLEELVRVEEGEGQLRLVFAESLYALGRVDEAHDAIAEARRQLLERASTVTDESLRESFCASVPHRRRTLELARAWLGEPA